MMRRKDIGYLFIGLFVFANMVTPAKAQTRFEVRDSNGKDWKGLF